MTDNLMDRLKAPLADRYTIERELGSGGMAMRSQPDAVMSMSNAKQRGD